MELDQGAVSVVVVDDDQHTCETMARLLNRSGYQATPLFDGQAALAHVMGQDPELLLIDHLMPGLSGTEVIEKLAGFHLRTVSVLFTGMNDKEVVRNAFRAGAVDVVFKPISLQSLIQVVEQALALARESQELDRCLHQLKDAMTRLFPSTQMPVVTESSRNAVIQIGELEIDQEQRRVFCDGQPCDLTALEFAILLHLARRANQVVTHQSLARAARGYRPERWVAQVFAKQHIRNIRRKIGDNAQSPRFIHTVHSQGYRLAIL